jgi:hypothetical protein
MDFFRDLTKKHMVNFFKITRWQATDFRIRVSHLSTSLTCACILPSLSSSASPPQRPCLRPTPVSSSLVQLLVPHPHPCPHPTATRLHRRHPPFFPNSNGLKRRGSERGRVAERSGPLAAGTGRGGSSMSG